MKDNRISGEDIPSCEIRIDKEGVWYFRGAEMFRRDIVKSFYDGLRQDSMGRYIIELGNESCHLEVEDTPFIVNAITVSDSSDKGDQKIMLSICDETVETLDPETLHIGNDNVLYCRVRNREFKARFSRASYYQIANLIDYHIDEDKYVLVLNGKAHRINGPAL
jgi:hypothetical protein